MRKGSPHLLGFVFASLQYFYQGMYATLESEFVEELSKEIF